MDSKEPRTILLVITIRGRTQQPASPRLMAPRWYWKWQHGGWIGEDMSSDASSFVFFISFSSSSPIVVASFFFESDGARSGSMSSAAIHHGLKYSSTVPKSHCTPYRTVDHALDDKLRRRRSERIPSHDRWQGQRLEDGAQGIKGTDGRPSTTVHRPAWLCIRPDPSHCQLQSRRRLHSIDACAIFIYGMSWMRDRGSRIGRLPIRDERMNCTRRGRTRCLCSAEL